MKSAKIIADAKKNTCIVPLKGAAGRKETQGTCGSACVYVFAAGERRVLNDSSFMGIHPSFYGASDCCAPINYLHSFVRKKLVKGNADDIGLGGHKVIDLLINKSDKVVVSKLSDFHQVTKQEFIEWKLGNKTDIGQGWYFIEK